MMCGPGVALAGTATIVEKAPLPSVTSDPMVLVSNLIVTVSTASKPDPETCTSEVGGPTVGLSTTAAPAAAADAEPDSGDARMRTPRQMHRKGRTRLRMRAL